MTEGILVNDLQIEAFLEVVRLGSFSKASQSIFVPQPTLTHRIKQLEDELGEMLIFRNSNGLSLTSAGKLFLPYARHIHESITKGRQQVDYARKGYAGVLSIGASLALSQYVLPVFLENFLKQHNRFRININAHPSDVIIRKLQERQFTFGLTRYQIADPNLQFEVLHHDSVHLIVPPDHRFCKLEQVTLQEACQEPILIYQEGTYFRDFIEKSLMQHHLRILNPLEINHAELIKSLVKSGFGLTFLPGLYVQKELDSGNLVAIPIQDYPFPDRCTYIAYHQGYTDGSFGVFLNYTREFFKSF